MNRTRCWAFSDVLLRKLVKINIPSLLQLHKNSSLPLTVICFFGILQIKLYMYARLCVWVCALCEMKRETLVIVLLENK